MTKWIFDIFKRQCKKINKNVKTNKPNSMYHFIKEVGIKTSLSLHFFWSAGINLHQFGLSFSTYIQWKSKVLQPPDHQSCMNLYPRLPMRYSPVRYLLSKQKVPFLAFSTIHSCFKLLASESSFLFLSLS